MKRADWLLLAALALTSSAWCFTASRQLGATFDEPFYFESGLDYWRRGHFGQLLSAGVMPLAPHLQTLPIFVAEQTTGRTLSVENDLGEMLRLARPVTLAFWVLLLASVMHLGRMAGGVWGGRLAAAIVAVEPNFLAHASLATTDIALAACFTAFVAQFLRGRTQGRLRRIVLPSMWFALALAAKASALALLPFAVGIAALRDDRRHLRRLLLDVAAILVIGVTFAVAYCGTGGGTWLHGTLERMPATHALRPLVAWLGSLPVFPNAFYAWWFQLAHNTTGQAVFVAGVASERALWFYVPVLLLIKPTVPLLLGSVIALAVTPAKRKAIVTAAIAVVAAMVIFRVQTGIRFFLPLLALAVAWVAAQLVTVTRPLKMGLMVLPLWIAAESLAAWPDALRYVNQIWGGTTEGYRVVSDSNYDWGQGLPELSRWRARDGRPMAVWYFGTDTRFPELIRYNPRQTSSEPAVLEGRLLAVSTSLLYGGYVESPGPARTLIARLRSATPIARTSTFLIFDTGY